MNCSKCKQPMLTGNQDGKPVYVCLACGVAIQIPQAGATTQYSPQARKSTVAREPSEGEVSFAEAWRDLHPSLPFETEYLFNVHRRWKCDFAWPNVRVAVEFEGWGHGTARRYEPDVEKYNALSHDEWLLFRCTKSMMEKDAERFCRMVSEVIRRREFRASPPAAVSKTDRD
jgi:hypothetical protein